MLLGWCPGPQTPFLDKPLGFLSGGGEGAEDVYKK